MKVQNEFNNRVSTVSRKADEATTADQPGAPDRLCADIPDAIILYRQLLRNHLSVTALESH